MSFSLQAIKLNVLLFDLIYHMTTIIYHRFSFIINLEIIVLC